MSTTERPCALSQGFPGPLEVERHRKNSFVCLRERNVGDEGGSLLHRQYNEKNQLCTTKKIRPQKNRLFWPSGEKLEFQFYHSENSCNIAEHATDGGNQKSLGHVHDFVLIINFFAFELT